MNIINDLQLDIATVNGSGSQSANNLLVKAIFRMGIPVNGKNFFPSNIAGLPTWFSVRVSQQNWLTRRTPSDIVVAMNKDTWQEDLAKLKPNGTFIYNGDFKIDPSAERSDVLCVALPCRDLVKKATDSVKLKKLLTNMIYVGVLAEILGISLETLDSVLLDILKGKAALKDSNMKAISAGFEFAKELSLEDKEPHRLQKIEGGNSDYILMDGNTAAALGAVHGGCQFLAWYPITPSSSLAENFEAFCHRYRKDQDGKNQFAVMQAEDELASIAMVIGAGWNGARAMTTTSGPGLSLMAESAGLSYFAEIPAVIWDVQRAGPSTGLPTRTMQSDLTSAATLSHGDTQHVVLIPGSIQECFDFAQTAFDLAERLQTLVIVLSDLDLGMNLWSVPALKIHDQDYDRGKVLAESDSAENFARYADSDDDGISQRSLPGHPDPRAAFFTRGSGHNEQAKYTESAENHKNTLDRLRKKFETAKTFIPAPCLEIEGNQKIGVIAFGSSDMAVKEAAQRSNYGFSYLRLRAIPFNKDVEDFIKKHDQVVVIDQNADGQCFGLLKRHLNDQHGKLLSLRHYDGMPLSADHILTEMNSLGVKL